MDILLAAVTVLSSGLAGFADKAPDPEDVKAGWGAFAIFAGLALAVALLGWSLTKQLKKTKANAEAGVFGDEPTKAPGESPDA
jgi:hypothetical protein